jgi:hypothetical protein
MTIGSSTKGAFIALAAASLFGCAASQANKSVAAHSTAPAVQCSGINACKAQGSCRGNENACKAKNDCKGKGWVEVASVDDCTAKGGKPL